MFFNYYKWYKNKKNTHFQPLLNKLRRILYIHSDLVKKEWI